MMAANGRNRRERHLQRRALMIALVCILGWFSAPKGHCQGSAQQRWESEDRGRIAFLSRQTEEHPVPVLCIMELPSYRVRTVTDPDVFEPFERATPTWSRDGKWVYVSGTFSERSGIWRIDARTGSLDLFTEAVSADLASRGKIIVPGERTGIPIPYSPPFFSYRDAFLAIGPKTGRLYALREYSFDQGPPGWRIDPDTLDVPPQFLDRLTAKLGQQRGDWVDIVVFDSSGEADVLSEDPPVGRWGFTVSPDEGKFATSDLIRVQIHDPSTGQTHIPSSPQDFVLQYPCYSPDGKSLFAVSRASKVRRSVLVSRAPNFEEFEILTSFHRDPDIHLSAAYLFFVRPSPDGAWLLVTRIRGRVGWGNFNLSAVELATGDHVEIPRPYLLDGEPAPWISLGWEFDWTD